MDEKRKRLIHLSRIPYMSRRMIFKLLKKDPSLQKIYSMTSTQLSYLFSISEEKALNIQQQIHNEDIEQLIKKDEEMCQIITLFDDDYPHHMKNLFDSPLVLYALGNSSLLNKQPSISVIGTRFPSSEGIPKLNVVVAPIIKEGWVIVSGLAYGIDSEAHLLTIRLKGET